MCWNQAARRARDAARSRRTPAALTFGSSNTASITSSAPAASSASVGRLDPRQQRVGLLLRRAAPLDAPSRQPLRVALAALGASSETSLSTTSMPAFAHTYAIAAPIMPAPRTAIFRGANGSIAVGPVAVPVDTLQIEEERLDHVLRHLAGDQVDEVAALDLDRVVEVDLRALNRGGHDVVRSRVVGALELLAQVGREGGQVLRQASGSTACRRGSCTPCGPTAVLRLWVGLDPRLRGGDQLLALRRRARRPGPISLALPGRWRWPWSSACISAFKIPSIRTVRMTPPAPGSRPSCTSGKPSTALRRHRRYAVVAGQADLAARRRARRR